MGDETAAIVLQKNAWNQFCARLRAERIEAPKPKHCGSGRSHKFFQKTVRTRRRLSLFGSNMKNVDDENQGSSARALESGDDQQGVLFLV